MTRAHIIELIGIALALAILITLILSLPTQGPSPHANVPPPLTSQEQAIAAASTSVAALVSYTDTGFAPATTTIAAGEAVRFFNASARDLWVAENSDDGTLYPASSSACGESGFDTCRVVHPQHFWEFTFAFSGEWRYHNNARTADTAVIVVTPAR